MRKHRILLALGLIAAMLGPASLTVAQDTAEDSKQPPDLARNAVDPYIPGGERSRFLKAAGIDTELEEAEFKADATADAGFVRPFDDWARLKQFDANKNNKIDWFEADAYRRDIRRGILAQFDADKNNRLNGAERDAANKALADGKLPKAQPATPAPGDQPRPRDDDRPRRGDRGERFRERFDTDGDGELSEAERRVAGATMIREGRDRMVDRFDTNGDGVLDADERAAAMNDRMGKWWLRMDDIGMKHFDADGDGQLDQEESMSMVRMGEQLQQVGKKWELKMMDTDGDGDVSRDERREMERRIRMIGIGLLPEAISWADADGDGTPSREELQAVGERAFKAWRKEADDWVERFDRDGDGRLGENERTALVQGIDEDIANRFKRNDADGDGQLSDREIRSLIVELAEEFDVKPK